MGTIFRRFWHPIAMSSDVAPGGAMPIRMMNEDLTLYRGQSGKPFVVADRCAHRLTQLYTGWVEEDCLRCRYHGWTYDGTGQCVEMPAELPSFAPKVKILAYPAVDYGGAVFVYMGEGEPPPLPRMREMERDYGVQWIERQIWPCNWMQQVENAMDAVHVSFVHREGNFGKAVTPVVPTLRFEETPWGMTQYAQRSPKNVRVSDWRFPNCNHISIPLGDAQNQPWTDVFNWVTPVDDDHSARIIMYSSPRVGQAAEEFRAYVESRPLYNPAEHEEELFGGVWPTDELSLIGAQDYIVQVAQGRIANRADEWLGRSDACLIYLRQLYRRELEALREGEAGKTWRPRDSYARLPTPEGIPPAPDPQD
jgi:5,5'-dehydrodivanillate O-demethylase